MDKPTLELVRKWFSYINTRGPIIRPELGPCWIWDGGSNSSGYGTMDVGGRSLRPHVLAYHFLKGNHDPNKVVMHKCDTPLCVNPAHLTLGTQSENMLDAAEKGRIRGAAGRGEKNSTAKLTEKQVREIRNLAERGYLREQLALQYGVSKLTIRDIVNRKTWQHV